MPQRLATGISAEDVLPQILKHRLQRQQLLGAIVNDEDGGFGVRHSPEC